MTRRDSVGELLEGGGTEDTTIDTVGDNTGDSGDEYRAAFFFGTTSAETLRGQSLEGLLAAEEPDMPSAEGANPEVTDRRLRRDLAQLLGSGEGSHSRTDPDLLGRDRIETGLSAEEAALHLI
jgi:hypothetical protein